MPAPSLQHGVERRNAPAVHPATKNIQAPLVPSAGGGKCVRKHVAPVRHLVNPQKLYRGAALTRGLS